MKGELIKMTQAWDKEKIRAPVRNQTHEIPDAISTEL